MMSINWKNRTYLIISLLLFGIQRNATQILTGAKSSELSVEAQWLPTKGAEGQVVIDLVAKGSTVFAGASAGPVPDTTYTGGVLRSTDSGATWMKVDSGFFTGTIFPIAVNSMLVVGDSLYAATSNGVFVTANDGGFWKQTSIGIDSDLASRAVQALVRDGNNLYAGTGNGIFYSSNLGSSWIRRDSGLYNNGPTYNEILCMASMGSTIFASVNYSRIFFSQDSGKSWNYYPTYGGEYQCLLVKDSAVFAGWNRLIVSTDTTKSWTHVDKGLQDTTSSPSNLYLESLYSIDNYIFAGTDLYGVFESSNNGQSWTAINTGLDKPLPLTIWSMVAVGDYMIIGTGGGVFRRPISEVETSVRPRQVSITKGFTLEQNYPNPFNPATIISFSLSSEFLVSLKVFDALGREVATLVNEKMSPGTYTRRWNAGNTSSGVYFYRLQAGTYSETKKLLLLK